MPITDRDVDQLLIVALTPYFLEKEIFWFQENLEDILHSAKTQPFFQDNTLFLRQGQSHHLSGLLRKLDEMGYERVFQVADPGEFSQKGGLLEIFPVNRTSAVRLDFLGNTLEHITELAICLENEQKSREVLRKKLSSQKLFSDLKNIKPGDYVTHLDHGVAQFQGIEKIPDPRDTSQPQEYYVLEYAKNDRLYVPVGLERKLARYVGFADPVVSRLGSSLWQKTKKKIKEDVERLAKELLALYAEKESITRIPYAMDQELESRLAEKFPHEETPDQLQAIADIRQDLQKEKPMDRIICGDVGFGKTEIAIRAAFLAAINNRQTAIICPTTILASQHYDNFKARFSHLPVRIALLSRLQTPAQQHNILAQLKEGKIDIIIGTHRLLSRDIDFKNIQLLIIDDEQRFGVKQKELLRHKNPSLDIMSLSATPIPRTIYLALSSFKNISIMQTPPQGRESIETHIAPYRAGTIKSAIAYELARKGQVYFLHNRIETMEKTRRTLEKLVPGATFSCIHGRMTERELIPAMNEFKKGKTDVLIATTIIENGIDLPGVNTIIIEDASRLGLAQAYQIRGRVGRSHTKGFAYFLHPRHLAGLAAERLRALGEANELGAGYRIAIKDLELRGAGNILGKEQSGSINKIGLNLYCQMLAESVEKMRQ